MDLAGATFFDSNQNAHSASIVLPSFDSIETLLPQSFLTMLNDTIDLEVSAPKNGKRLVESILFSCCVLSIIYFSYCFREINI